MEIVAETSSAEHDGKHGCIPVGATPTRLWHSTKFYRGVMVRAAKSNSVPIHVGINEGVTADTSLTGGLPIYPGDMVSLPFDSPAEIFCVATLENQKLFWIGV